MVDPVVAGDGSSYERSAIEEWFRRGHRLSPTTNLRLPHINLIPNITLRKVIQSLQQELPEYQWARIASRQEAQDIQQILEALERNSPNPPLRQTGSSLPSAPPVDAAISGQALCGYTVGDAHPDTARLLVPRENGPSCCKRCCTGFCKCASRCFAMAMFLAVVTAMALALLVTLEMI
ncbi:unnamed protein product [Polarella glacialis]|uniref:U-box domain-containing protein n=1 Tax=Polarella glacialis TaxID=89957 RepID=A0A813GFJ6_POLGL|nr:unnamed protein product [Polarella glacialis]